MLFSIINYSSLFFDCYSLSSFPTTKQGKYNYQELPNSWKKNKKKKKKKRQFSKQRSRAKSIFESKHQRESSQREKREASKINLN